MTLPELLLNVFRGRDDYVAVGTDAGFRPQVLECPLKPEWVQEKHLGGKRCFGFYLMRDDHTVLCSCVDFDNKPERPNPAWKDDAEKVYGLLSNVGLHPLVEVSASGEAAHVWLIFSDPVEAWIIRAFWRAVSDYLDVPMPEVYPRQEQLSGKGLGNLVRYPLWGRSHFPDVESEWAVLDPIETLTAVKRCDAYDLRTVAFEMGFGELKPESIIEDGGDGSGLSVRVRQRLARKDTLLSKRWHGIMLGLGDESRSALVQSIACEMVRMYIPTPEVEQALRHWCHEHGYDKGQREDWIARTVSKAYDFVGNRTEARSIEATTLHDAVGEFIDTLAAGIKPCIPTGVIEVDESIDGVGYGEMAVVAARPSHGKSAFGLQWIDTAANQGIPALIVSEEMSRLELGKRALLSITELEEPKWREASEQLRAEVDQWYSLRQKIHLVESCNTIDRCEEVIDQHCSIYGVKVVAVDYLQLLGGRGQSRYDDVTDISRRLKQAAKRNDCALIAMCQLNREIEKRDSWEPRLSDLRESGQIEQDADLILFLHWPIKTGHTQDPTTYYVFPAKRRNGPIRSQRVETVFDAEHQRFGFISNSNYESK